MKVAELLVEPVFEGVWVLPRSMGDLKALMKLLDEPFHPADSDKVNALYYLLGDDDLHDDIARARVNKEVDARKYIITHLPRLLDTRTWRKKPDELTQFGINQLLKKYVRA